MEYTLATCPIFRDHLTAPDRHGPGLLPFTEDHIRGRAKNRYGDKNNPDDIHRRRETKAHPRPDFRHQGMGRANGKDRRVVVLERLQEGDDAGCQDGRFTEGFDTANLKDAKALLEHDSV